MLDFFRWSIPLGALFGITIRIHILFPFVAVGLILRSAFQKGALPGWWIDASLMMVILFVSVLLHEFGHCFGARFADGDAQDILLWPLGGLASIEVPHTAWANFIATAAGPFVNLVLFTLSGLGFLWLTNFDLQPTWNPLWLPYRSYAEGAVLLYAWDGSEVFTLDPAVILLARIFSVNWILFWFNVLLPAFPLDGGRLFQCALWPWVGFRSSMMAAIYGGFLTALLLGIAAIGSNELLVLCLAFFIYTTCQQQYYFLESGAEDSLLGYDFSQGYTSLERDQPEPRKRRRPNFWQRWLQRRTARKLQREQEQREYEERRMDELLEKIHREGEPALTDEERRFLKRVSDRYRNQ